VEELAVSSSTLPILSEPDKLSRVNMKLEAQFHPTLLFYINEGFQSE
jgi:hypothetical protein